MSILLSQGLLYRIPSSCNYFEGHFLNLPNGMCTVLSFLTKKTRCAKMASVNVIERNLQQQKCSNAQ